MTLTTEPVASEPVPVVPAAPVPPAAPAEVDTAKIAAVPVPVPAADGAGGLLQATAVQVTTAAPAADVVEPGAGAAEHPADEADDTDVTSAEAQGPAVAAGRAALQAERRLERRRRRVLAVAGIAVLVLLLAVTVIVVGVVR